MDQNTFAYCLSLITQYEFPQKFHPQSQSRIELDQIHIDEIDIKKDQQNQIRSDSTYLNLASFIVDPTTRFK